MGLEVRNGSEFVILSTRLVRLHFGTFEEIHENHENHWFSTAKSKHFNDFVSHKVLLFLYFFFLRPGFGVWESRALIVSAGKPTGSLQQSTTLSGNVRETLTRPPRGHTRPREGASSHTAR